MPARRGPRSKGQRAASRARSPVAGNTGATWRREADPAVPAPALGSLLLRFARLLGLLFGRRRSGSLGVGGLLVGLGFLLRGGLLVRLLGRLLGRLLVGLLL